MLGGGDADGGHGDGADHDGGGADSDGDGCHCCNFQNVCGKRIYGMRNLLCSLKGHYIP